MKKQKCKQVISTFLVGIMLIGTMCGFTPIESEAEALRAIDEQGVSVDFEEPYQELSALDDILPDYDIYIAGEGHAVKMNYVMQEYMFKYFVEEKGTKYLLAELSYSEGELLNEYLETGNTKLLNEIVDAFEGSLAYNQDVFNFYKWLYKYNQSRPLNRKIKIVAIDVEHQKVLADKYLMKLVKKHEDTQPSQNIEDILSKLKRTSKNSIKTEDREFCKEIAESLEKYSSDYQKYFKDDFFSFSLMSRNILASTEDFTERESAMIQNFNDLYQHLSKGSYFGQLGAMHMGKTKIQYDADAPQIDSFANAVNSKIKGLQGKVYTIRYIYNNSQYRDVDGKVRSVGELTIPSLVGDEATAMFFEKNSSPGLYSYLTSGGGDAAMLGDAFYLINNSLPVSKRINS